MMPASYLQESVWLRHALPHVRSQQCGHKGKRKGDAPAPDLRRVAGAGGSLQREDTKCMQCQREGQVASSTGKMQKASTVS